MDPLHFRPPVRCWIIRFYGRLLLEVGQPEQGKGATFMQAIELVKGYNKEIPQAQVVERLGGHYETQEVPFGVVYRWRPECLIIHCRCGERTTLTGTLTGCSGCGADCTALVGKGEIVRAVQADETCHPWRYAGNREGFGLPC